MITSVVYTIFENTCEVLAKHGDSVVLAQNGHVAIDQERYQMKESGLGKTYDLDILCCKIVPSVFVPSYRAQILSL